jgi:hypothetical protein
LFLDNIITSALVAYHFVFPSSIAISWINPIN